MKNNFKIITGGVLAVIIILTTIMTALNLFEDETINNYITISKLNAKSMSKEINQDITNIELIIKNISSGLHLSSDVNSNLNEILKSYPQIRSINILKESKIIYSSNMDNIGLLISNLNLYPQTIFDDNILKVSSSWIGRDFIDGTNIYNYEEKINTKDSYFIPISKEIYSQGSIYNVVVNLNNDYFTNRFLTNIDTNKVFFELIRLDGSVLLSSDNFNPIGKVIKNSALIEEAIEKNISNGIELINNKKFIVTYILTRDYPLYLSVKFDLEKNLLTWNQKQFDFFFITSFIVIFSISIALIFFYLFNKKQEEEIQSHKLQIQENKKFKLLFQDSHFLAIFINENGQIIDANNNVLKFLNKKIEKTKALKFWELDCWEYEEKRVFKHLINNNEIKDTYSNEVNALTTGNQRVVFDLNLSVLSNDDSKFYMVIALDITQRKEREKKLLQAYTVFNNTHDGIMITDRYSNILDVNKAFEDITGYKKSEIIYKNTRMLKSNIHSEEFYKNIWDNLNEKGFWEGEIINLNKKRELFIEWLTINAIYNKDKKVINYIGIFSDITEQKQKDELLKEKEKVIYQQSKMASMGEMIENIAHQWRQPLSMISMVSTGIKMKKEIGTLEDEELFEDLNSINESAQFLSNTIEDFRSYLKNDKNKEYFDIYEIIEYALKLFSSKLGNRNIEIIKNYEHINILGIKNEFVQVMMNIISNAKDALESIDSEDKLILIETQIKKDYLIVQIKDNAGGIKEEIIDKVFEPYFTTKHQSQGTGIGLYMSEQIVRNHMEGSLSVKNQEFTLNEKNYKGACFKIEIPIE